VFEQRLGDGRRIVAGRRPRRRGSRAPRRQRLQLEVSTLCSIGSQLAVVLGESGGVAPTHPPWISERSEASSFTRSMIFIEENALNVRNLDV
jgi:hypothetical protein